MRILVILFFLLLSACGFHLRGVYQLPPGLQQVYVGYVQTYDPFVVKLRQALLNAKVSLSSQEAEAKYILQINQISQNPVVQSTSTTGQVTTYSMQYTVNFTLLDKSGKVLLPAQSVQSAENYTLTSTQLLTSFNQAPSNLTSELQQDAINQIMARLSSKNAAKALSMESEPQA